MRSYICLTIAFLQLVVGSQSFALARNQSPVWAQSQLTFSEAVEDQAYVLDVSPYASDPDGDPLKFSKDAGPAWLSVSEAGLITGTPKGSDVGDYTARIAVTDGKATVAVDVQGQILHKNFPPEINEEALNFKVKEREIFKVNLNDFVFDMEGSPLTFTFELPLSFVTLTPEGDMVVTPTHPHVGPHELVVLVSDGESTSKGTIKLTVERDPQPPVWVSTPLKIEVGVGDPVAYTFVDKVKDPDGEPLTFTKVSGPDWLTVTPKGEVSGTPGESHPGENVFVVSAKNDGVASEIKFVVSVKVSELYKQVVSVDKPVPGAGSEALWIMDNPGKPILSPVSQSVREQIASFWKAMKRAQVHQNTVFLSADAAEWDGEPVPGEDESLVIPWNVADWFEEFQVRAAETGGGKAHASALWSVQRFRERASEWDEDFAGLFAVEATPLEIFVVTDRPDAHALFAKGTPSEGKAPGEYLAAWVEAYAAKRKAVRLNAIAPLEWKALCEKTGGVFKDAATPANVKQTLLDFARSSAMRAFIFAKALVKLDKVPQPGQEIKVSVAGKPLAKEVWSYEGAQQAIRIDWSRVDVPSLKSGDALEIAYRPAR